MVRLHTGCLGTGTSWRAPLFRLVISPSPLNHRLPSLPSSQSTYHVASHSTSRTKYLCRSIRGLVFRQKHAEARRDARLHAQGGRHHLRSTRGGRRWPKRRSRGHLSEVPYRHIGGMLHAALAFIAHRHSRLAQRERLHVHAPYITRGG